MNELEHLLSLASRGGNPWASSGEKQARAIVECLLENVICLDTKATDGITELIHYIEADPMEGRHQIRRVARIPDADD